MPVPEDHFDEQTAGGVAASVAASAVGATAGFIVAGPTGAAAATVTAPVLQALINFVGLRFERARQKAARVVTDAAAQNGVSEDQLISEAEHSSQKTELAAEVIYAATRATTEQKLKALAMALARGVQGDDNIAAQERITVAALADLEPLHIAVMTCLLTQPPSSSSEEKWQEVLRNPPDGAYGWLPSEVVEKLPETEPVIDAIFAALDRHGLVIDTAIGTLGYKARYVATSFGRRCLDWLEANDA